MINELLPCRLDNINRSADYQSDQLTVLESEAEIRSKVKEVVVEVNKANNNMVTKTDLKVNRKLDEKGDFTGSWFGFDKPVASEPGIQNQVNKNTDNIVNINHNIDNLTINIMQPPNGITPAKCDGVTDDSETLQQCLNLAYQTGKSIYIPNITRITKTIELIQTLPLGGRAFPTIYGNSSTGVNHSGTVQGGTITGSVILYDGTGTALKIKANRGVGQGVFTGGCIKDIAIIKKNSDRVNDNSVGIEFEGCCDWRAYNISTMGFGIGFKNIYGWSWDIFGMTSIRNHIGIYLGDNSNAIGIFGLQGHQNNYGVKIESGSGILIKRATLEGQKIGVLINYTKGANYPSPSVNLENVHIEQVTETSVRVGKDEFNLPCTGEIEQLFISDMQYSNTNQVYALDIDNLNKLIIDSANIQNVKTYNFGENIKNVTFKNSSYYDINYLSSKNSYRNNVGYKNNRNILPNGNLCYKNINLFKLNTLASVKSGNHKGEMCTQLVYPSNPTKYYGILVNVKIPNELVGKTLLFSMRMAVDSGFTITPIWFNDGYTAMTGGNMGVCSLEDYQVFNATITPTTNNFFLAFQGSNTSGVEKTAYVQTMVLVEKGQSEIHTSTLDIISSNTGRATATNGNLVKNIMVEDFLKTDYEVIVTPYFNGNVYVTKNDGSFDLTFSGNGSCSYLIIPTCGII